MLPAVAGCFMLKIKKNKIAIVTGANGGIGTELVAQLEKAGVRWVCVDKAGIVNENFLLCDFSKQEEVENLVDTISAKFETIDFLFNIAGVGIYKSIEDLTIKEWNDSLAINLSAPYILLKGLLPLLERSESALVINFGSGMGMVPYAKRTAYCASKFGLRGLILSLSKEFKSRKVKFILLTLGSVMTNFGTGGLEARKKLSKNGKRYLTVNSVVRKVVGIINSPVKKPEYIIYPEGYLSSNLGNKTGT